MIISRVFIYMSLVYSIFLNILFFSKKRVDNHETKIYSYLLVANFFGLLFELSSGFAIELLPDQFTLINLLLKLFLIYLSFFATVLTFYVLNVSFLYNKNEDNEKNIIKCLIFLALSW